MRISFDFDGVLCLTPFGRMAVHAPDAHVDVLPEAYESFYEGPAPRSRLRLAVEWARFGWRRMAPDAAQVLHDLSAAGHDLLIVTGRSAHGEPLLRGWLRRHRLDDKVTAIRMAPGGLRPPQHKLAIAKMLAVDVHIDDDPRTAFYLARNGVPHVFLLDHAGALGDVPLPENVHTVRSLQEFLAGVRAIDVPPA
jgi:phosphoglycolate phosphatase-like HAD superfamily hydrolase